MAKRGQDKPKKQYLILEEYLQGAYYTLPEIVERLEVHLHCSHDFELGKPITVTLIPVKYSAFYLMEG